MILYATHPSVLCLCVRLGQCSACLLVWSSPHHIGLSVCLSPFNPSLRPDFSAPISPQLIRRSSIPHPHPRVCLCHTSYHSAPCPPAALTSCSVLVGGIEESILFRSVPCMLLLARWFSHPAVTPPTPQGLPRCAQLSLKTLPCRHGSLGSPCWRSALRVMTLVLSPNIYCSERVPMCQLAQTRRKPAVPYMDLEGRDSCTPVLAYGGEGEQKYCCTHS